MSGIDCAPSAGSLVIGDVSMNNGAWCALDLTPLWAEVAVRGGDRLIPTLDGVVPYRRRITVTEHSLPLLICGEVDHLGIEYPDPWVGLEENLAYLRANVVDPVATTAGTRAAQLTMPSGDVRTAAIHVLDLRLGEPIAPDPVDGAIFRASLEISIPAGRFT